jgi:hypothetical protein
MDITITISISSFSRIVNLLKSEEARLDCYVDDYLAKLEDVKEFDGERVEILAGINSGAKKQRGFIRSSLMEMGEYF